MPPSNRKQANWVRTMLTRKKMGKTSLTVPQARVYAPGPSHFREEGDDSENDGAMVVEKKTKRGWLDAFDGE